MFLKENYMIDFCITHFLRVEGLINLVKSIRKYYPDANITIACQGEIPLDEALNGCNMLATDFDSGLSYNRNRLVDITHRPFILMLEDDFVFTEKTSVGFLLKLMDVQENIGVVGGLVKELGHPLHWEHKFRRDGDTLYHESDGDDWVKHKTPYKETGCVLNFALFRREMLEEIQWDDEQKLAEHQDFYLRLKDTKWRVLYTEATEIDTKKINSPEYKSFKKRQEFRERLLRKHNLKKVVYADGYTMMLKDDKLITGKNL